MSTFERVKKIIIRQLGVDAEKVSSATSFTDLGADSLDTIELLTAFEAEFGVYVPDDVLEAVLTVGDVVNVMDRRPLADA